MPPQIGIIMAIKIASIDAGVSTGLVIAKVKHQVEYVVLNPKLITTTQETPNGIMSILDNSRIRLVVLERMPDFGDKHGKKFYEAVQNYYQDPPKDKRHYSNAVGKVLYQVAPGHWKPFMAHRLGLLPECNSQHEKDALAMLFYFVQVNNQGKRVIYE